jgi:hypothetical protein
MLSATGVSGQTQRQQQNSEIARTANTVSMMGGFQKPDPGRAR